MPNDNMIPNLRAVKNEADAAAVRRPEDVPTEAALTGKPAGQYALVETAELVSWNGAGITARGPDTERRLAQQSPLTPAFGADFSTAAQAGMTNTPLAKTVLTKPVIVAPGQSFRMRGRARDKLTFPPAFQGFGLKLLAHAEQDSGQRTEFGGFIVDAEGAPDAKGLSVNGNTIWGRDFETRNSYIGLEIGGDDHTFLHFYSAFGASAKGTAVRFNDIGPDSGEGFHFTQYHMGNSPETFSLWSGGEYGIFCSHGSLDYAAKIVKYRGDRDDKLQPRSPLNFSLQHIEYNPNEGHVFFANDGGHNAGYSTIFQSIIAKARPSDLFSNEITNGFIKMMGVHSYVDKQTGGLNVRFPDGVYVPHNPDWSPNGQPTKLGRYVYDDPRSAWDDRPKVSNNAGGGKYLNEANGPLTIRLPVTWNATPDAEAFIQARLYGIPNTKTGEAAALSPLLPRASRPKGFPAGAVDVLTFVVPAGCLISWEWGNVSFDQPWSLSYFG